MPTLGRGGAGNIQALEQESSKTPADLEANQTADTKSILQSDCKREEAQYAHSGRGGAGNYYSPKDLEDSGRFEGADTSHVLGDGTPAPGARTETSRAEPARHYGRGGAGNYAWDAVDNEARAAKQREEEEARKKEQLSADVERGVADAIAMPPKAKLPYGET